MIPRPARQVKVRSKDEFGKLAASFNQMSLDLERATQARRQMTADIAHDLRNPLSILLGYTEALSDGKLSGTTEIFDTMHDSAGQLCRLVDDLRTLSLADAGELPIQPQSTHPASMLERARQSYAARAEAQGVSLQVSAAEDLPTIKVDPERMAQVFANLVSNALRYTPHGGMFELSACLSFHAKKILAIGRGGMILTDSPEAATWLRKARYDGREGKPYQDEQIDMLGWHCYMTPEQAARGMLLMDILPESPPDHLEDYPDLRNMPVFR